MLHLRPILTVVAVIAMLGLGDRAHAQVTMKHSGSIVSIDEKAGTIALAEVGPWKVRAGKTVLTVDCLHEGKRLVALKITVVEVAEP